MQSAYNNITTALLVKNIKDEKNTIQTAALQDEIDCNQVDEIIARIGGKTHNVIPLLQEIQKNWLYLPQQALERICETTEITPADISGISTFYSQFRHKPAGKHSIKVCIGTACHVMGANDIYEAFKKSLQIPENEDTDQDRLFTVEKVACLGCCMLAPAVQIDDITYGFLTAQTIDSVMRDFLEAQSAAVSDKTDKGFTGKEIEGEIRMCLCSSCTASGALKVYQELERQIKTHQFPVRLKNTGCTGMAYDTPLLDIAYANGQSFRYARVQPQDINRMLTRHFKHRGWMKRQLGAVNRLLENLYTDEHVEPVKRYTTRPGGEKCCGETNGKAIVTQHAGKLDPMNLTEYIQTGGFEALKKCVLKLDADSVIRIIKESGLRGRGGGGFETWRKWRALADAEGEDKYLICNGDEGDPGAFMDRMILESFPYRVIEGITIAAVSAGIRKGFLYIRAEYPLALERIKQAITICRENGFLGKNILKTRKHFDLEVVSGAGAFVCGEETALIAAVEGRRGTPRLRPPYPSESGLWNAPTLVNNVETFAMVPWIILEGAESFAKLGTEKSKGTKSFALAGKINKSGLIEVPMGMTLRNIVEEIGGGIPDGKKLKAIQVGGPSGGCVPASLADTPVDYEALTEAGAMMGSGGMVALDETDCMVDIARYFMSFTQDESCGKCTFCRIGTKRMLEILDRLCEGKGRSDDIEKLEELCCAVKSGSLCGLGRTAPNPVLSTLTYFRDEYEAHIQGRCPAGKCKALITYSITDDCIGCTRCAQRCLAEAIKMTPYKKHIIDDEKCTRCDTCRLVCPVEAVRIQ